MEPETEGHEEQDQDGYEFEKCLAYVQEHNDVDAEVWQFPNVPEKVEPGKNYGRGTNLVLPTLDEKNCFKLSEKLLKISDLPC